MNDEQWASARNIKSKLRDCDDCLAALRRRENDLELPIEMFDRHRKEAIEWFESMKRDLLDQFKRL